MTKHVIFYSGGIGSYATAQRVIEREGKENVTLLFTDTKMEDDDLYRFIDESVKHLGCEYIYLADGRTPWEVFEDTKFLGNSRLAKCSHVLKQKVADDYIKEHYKPHKPDYILEKINKGKEIIYLQDESEKEKRKLEWERDERLPAILYLGIDWTESHRQAAPIYNYAPYEVRFPMCDEPYIDKQQMIQDLEDIGIRQPRLYELGFAHNNCGGFCVRAGQGHFKNLLDKLPERYKEHEEKEQYMRDLLGKDVSILRKQKDGVRYNVTLREFREDVEKNDEKNVDMCDIGGCGCFVTSETE